MVFLRYLYTFESTLHAMKTLTGVKRLSAVIGLNEENFIQIHGYKVPRAFIRNFIVFSLLTAVMVEILVYVKNREGGINSILAHLYIVVCLASMLFTYLCLVWQNNELVRLFDYLQMVINERMFSAMTNFQGIFVTFRL